MNHDLLLLVLRSRIGVVILGFRIIAHLNILISIATFFFVDLIVVIVTLILDILTLCVGDIVVVVVRALHIVVLALGWLFALLRLLQFFQKGVLELHFLLTIGNTIIIKTVSFGLVRWVFGGSIGLRVPGKITVSSSTHMKGIARLTI